MKRLSEFVRALAEGKGLVRARDESGYKNYSAIEKDLSGVIDRLRAAMASPETKPAVEKGKPEYLTIYCDGASRGNPGPAAAAAIAYLPSGEVLTSRTEKLGKTTNNVAEYRAVILALELSLDLGVRDVVLKIDSQLVVNQMNGEYRIKSEHLRELVNRVRQLAGRFSRCEFHHIPRAENRAADKLAGDVIRNERNAPK